MNLDGGVRRIWGFEGKVFLLQNMLQRSNKCWIGTQFRGRLWKALGRYIRRGRELSQKDEEEDAHIEGFPVKSDSNITWGRGQVLILQISHSSSQSWASFHKICKQKGKATTQWIIIGQVFACICQNSTGAPFPLYPMYLKSAARWKKKIDNLFLNSSLFCKCQYEDGQKVHWGGKQDAAVFPVPGGWAAVPYSYPAAAELFKAAQVPQVMLVHLGPSDQSCLLHMHQCSQLNSTFSQEVPRLVGTVNN